MSTYLRTSSREDPVGIWVIDTCRRPGLPYFVRGRVDSEPEALDPCCPKKGTSYQLFYANTRLIFNDFSPPFLNCFTCLIHCFFRTAPNTVSDKHHLVFSF